MAYVPLDVRNATRPLSEIEFLEIQKHPIRTANILQKTPSIPDIVTLVAYQSHERPDGSGYPRGRDKKSIHAFARILLVADSYTAMTSARPHRRPMMPYAAMETLIRQAQQWRVDPPVVRNLLHVLGLFPIGSYVVLSDGSVAKVIRSNGEDFTRPVALRVQDAQGRRINDDDESAVVDLSTSEVKVVQALPTPGRDEIGMTPQAAARPA
jgi:HD-GYP domain-containing protein (c-di-GMP phosphodiesterase class II)